MVKITSRSAGYLNLWRLSCLSGKKKILSLLVMMFMFSFGFNCSAIEDYLVYTGCKETNCSKCQKFLYNICYIHFERNPNVDVEEIYKNKNHFFCRDCMLKYFVDAFDKNRDSNMDDYKTFLKCHRWPSSDSSNKNSNSDIWYNPNHLASCQMLFVERIEERYIKQCQNKSAGEDGRRYIPFPCEYSNKKKINRFDKCPKCRSCTLITSLCTAACGKNGHMICYDCSQAWEKKDTFSTCPLCESRYWIYCPEISGEDILREFENRNKLNKNIIVKY